MKTRVLVYGLGGKIGGMEEYLLNLYRHVDQTQIAFDIIPHGGADFYAADEVNRMGGEIYPVFGEDHSFSRKRLNEVLKNERSRHQVIYFNVCALYRLDPFVMAKRYHYPIVVHSHNTMDPGRGIIANDVHRMNRLLVRNWSDKCFACSSAAGEWLFGEKYFHSKSKCSVINNAIDLDEHKFNCNSRVKVRREFGLSDSKKVFLSVGRLVDQKNQQFSIRIFSRILKKEPDSCLILVGEGPNEQILRKLSMELGIEDSVIFTGSRTDVNDIMCAADLLLLPSLYEGFGIVAIEAQASGLPILASSKIPDEAVVLQSLVKRMSLDSDVEKWSECAIKQIQPLYERTSHNSELSLAGYNANLLAKNMQIFFQGYNNEQ